jgi:hypothetical protein
MQKVYDVLFNPLFTNKKIDNPTAQELINLYENTGNKSVLLPTVDRKIKFTNADGEKVNKQLTEAELSEYQRVLGQLNYNSINDLINQSSYQNLPESEKIKMIKSRFEDNNAFTKNKLFGVPLKTNKKTPSAKEKQEKLLSRRRSVNRKIYQNSLEDLFNDVYYQE